MARISERAVKERINRKLARDGQVMRTLRGERWLSDLGRYYIVDDRNNVVVRHVDIGELASELGVLRQGEAAPA